jgi:hypothetical protein
MPRNLSCLSPVNARLGRVFESKAFRVFSQLIIRNNEDRSPTKQHVADLSKQALFFDVQ